MEQQAQALLKALIDAAVSAFGRTLTGVYLHGSLAMGGFRWAVSDVDLLVVTAGTPALDQKERYVRRLLDLAEAAPPKGLEISVLTESAARSAQHPMAYALHFSNRYREACRRAPRAFCQRMTGTDRDLAAHVAVLRQRGRTLWGIPAGELFAPVPVDAYWDSICSDVTESAEEPQMDSVYLVLNLCRVLAYRRTGRILSKEEGGLWGIQWLPPACRKLAAQALACYQGTDVAPEDWETLGQTAFVRAVLGELRQGPPVWLQEVL